MNNIFDQDEEVFMLETDRLLLRGWHESDLPEWVAMNADEDVRRYFPDLLTPEVAIERAVEYQEEVVTNGFGLWAVETREAIAYLDSIAPHVAPTPPLTPKGASSFEDVLIRHGQDVLFGRATPQAAGTAFVADMTSAIG